MSRPDVVFTTAEEEVNSKPCLTLVARVGHSWLLFGEKQLVSLGESAKHQKLSGRKGGSPPLLFLPPVE